MEHNKTSVNDNVKITRFCDIPKFTNDGSWNCDFSFAYLVDFIETEINEMGLILNPDFQRGHVWTEEQQIAWIEFFLKGGKTGRTVYLNNPSWHRSVKDGKYNEYVCVDGLQRITAIRRFVNNEIKVFGSYYKEFTDNMRFNQTIKVNINDLKTKKEVLQWYIDMNNGGTPHTKEEIDRVRELMSQLQ